MLAHVLGVDMDAEAVDLATHKTKVSNVDFYTINKKGNVPCLVFPDGRQLIENAVIMQYLADLKPDSTLFAKHGDIARYFILNEVNFIASELHPGFGVNFHKGSEEVNKFNLGRTEKPLKVLEDKLALSGGEFLTEKRLTIADFYAYIILNWHRYINLDISKHTRVKAYFDGLEKNAQIADSWKFVTGHPTKTV